MIIMRALPSIGMDTLQLLQQYEAGMWIPTILTAMPWPVKNDTQEETWCEDDHNILLSRNKTGLHKQYFYSSYFMLHISDLITLAYPETSVERY